MNKILLVLSIILFLVIVWILWSRWDDSTEVRGSCGLYFRVLDLEDKKVAAEIFCELDKRSQILKKTLRVMDDIRAKRILEFYESSDMRENPEETFTVNKGDKINICLRDPETDKFFPINELMYVFLHELSHISTTAYDNHGQEFWENFRWLLKISIDVGVYTYVDYSKTPFKYCGNTIVRDNLLRRR